MQKVLREVVARGRGERAWREGVARGRGERAWREGVAVGDLAYLDGLGGLAV
jgi:hypothetical protein